MPPPCTFKGAALSIELDRYLELEGTMLEREMLSDGDLATTLRTCSAVLLNPPASLVPDAGFRASWRTSFRLDARAPKDALGALPPDASREAAIAGCLVQLKLLRQFVAHLVDAPGDEPLGLRFAHALDDVLATLRDDGLAREDADPGSESSSAGEAPSLSSDSDSDDAPPAIENDISSDDSDDDAGAGAGAVEAAPAAKAAIAAARNDPLRLAAAAAKYADNAASLELSCDALADYYGRRSGAERPRAASPAAAAAEAAAVSGAVLAALRAGNAHPAAASAPARRRSALRAVAAAAAAPDGATFVERFAAHGGLAALVAALRHSAPDERSQVFGLGVLGHARLLDRDVARINAGAAAAACLDALGRHQRCAQLVGLAALALTNFAVRDAGAAALAADRGAVALLVAALYGLTGDAAAVAPAHAAGCWALGALSSLEGLRDDGSTVHLAPVLARAGAADLFTEVQSRFPSTAAARNASLAAGQLADAERKARDARAATPDDDADGKCAVS